MGEAFTYTREERSETLSQMTSWWLYWGLKKSC